MDIKKGAGVGESGIVGTVVGERVAVRVGVMIGVFVSVGGITVGAALQAPRIRLIQLTMTTIRLRGFIFTSELSSYKQRCPQFSDSYAESCGRRKAK